MGVNGLDFQTVDVRFDKGLDTKTEKKLVIPGKWNQLNNCSLCDDGTPRRRDGITGLVPAATGNGLATYNDELLVVNGPTVSTLSTGGVDQVKAVSGEYGFVGVDKLEISHSSGFQASMDCATGGGYTCYVWAERSDATTQVSLNVSVLDETTGARLQHSAVMILSATAICPRVVAGIDAFFIFYIDLAGGPTELYCRVIRYSTPTTLGAQTVLVSSVNLTVVNFDASIALSQIAAVAYVWADGVTSVRSIRVTQTAGVPSVSAGPLNLITEAQLPNANVCGLSIIEYSTFLIGVFTWGFGATTMAGIAGVTINASTWAIASGPTQLGATGPAVNTACHIAACRFGADFRVFTDNQSSIAVSSLNALRMAVTSSVLTGTSVYTIASSAGFATGLSPMGVTGPWIAGKPFTTATSIFLPVCTIDRGLIFATGNPITFNAQSTAFLFDVTSGVGVVVAKALAGTYGPAAGGSYAVTVATPCSSPQVLGGGFALVCTEKTLLVFVNGFNLSPTGVVRLTWTPNTTRAPIRAQLGESTYLAGGSTTSYDGTGVVEHGFPIFPDGIYAVVAVGGTMTPGVHQVVVVAEWIDDAGQRHQSAPSRAISFTTTAPNAQFTLQVPSLRMSQKTGVMLVPYMTAAAGLTFNRAVAPTGTGQGTLNDPAQAFTTTATVDLPDADYASNELLYTQPNQAGTTLPNIAPNPSNALAVIQNRLFYDRADQPGQFGYSQQYVNNVGLQTNDQFGGAVDVNGGAIIGFSSLDEKVIIFCERKPYVVYGTGPNAAGGFSNYSDPQELPSDIGCSDVRSILKIPNGIIFKSEKGWYLLGRDLATRYIGDGVAAYDGFEVLSAVMMGDRQECRFSVTDGETYLQLIYAYLDDQWSTSNYRIDSGQLQPRADPLNVLDAVYWPTGGYYSTLALAYGLNRDTPGTFLDQPGGAAVAWPIITTGRTAWLRLAIINGFQRVRRLFLTGTASSQRPESILTCAVDFDDSYGLTAPGSYQFTFDYLTQFAAAPVNTSVDIRHHLQRQKCKSVAFTFTDTPTVTTPQGVVFQALSLELGLKRGVRKLPASQST